MTLSREQFLERMIDYVYDELTGDELRAFDDYLRESAEARRELAALQSSLRVARQGLAHSSAEEPPARVRDAVLAAAQAQARQMQHAARSARAIGTPADESTLWSRLRASWLLPTLGVAAATALAVFGKNSGSPKPSHESEAPPAVSAPAERSRSAAAPVASPPPAAESEATARASGKLEDKARPPADQQPEPARRAARGEAASKGFAVPPPDWAAKHKPALSTQHESRYAEAPAALSADRAGEALDTQREAAANRDQRAAKASASAEGAQQDELLADEVPGGLPTAAPVARAPAAASAQRFQDDMLSGSLDGAGARREREPDPSAHTVTTLLRHANEHFAAKRWQQAEAAFRELLRRYPADARAPSWKKQLALATQALHDTR